MSVFCLLLRRRLVAPHANALQDSVPRAGATPRTDARKLSHPSPRRLSRDVPGSPE